LAGVPGSLFGCSDAGDAGWLRIILQTGVSGCSTQYFLASAVRLSISSRFAKDVGVGVIFAIHTLQFLCSNWESTLVNGIGLASFWIFCANFVSDSLHGSCRRVGSRC